MGATVRRGAPAISENSASWPASALRATVGKAPRQRSQRGSFAGRLVRHRDDGQSSPARPGSELSASTTQTARAVGSAALPPASKRRNSGSGDRKDSPAEARRVLGHTKTVEFTRERRGHHQTARRSSAGAVPQTVRGAHAGHRNGRLGKATTAFGGCNDQLYRSWQTVILGAVARRVGSALPHVRLVQSSWRPNRSARAVSSASGGARLAGRHGAGAKRQRPSASAAGKGAWSCAVPAAIRASDDGWARQGAVRSGGDLQLRPAERAALPNSKPTKAVYITSEGVHPRTPRVIPTRPRGATARAQCRRQ